MAAKHDLALSFGWSGLSDAQLANASLSLPRNAKKRFAMVAIISNLVRAHRADRWISYSRDKNHYPQHRRYQGAAYTYANVTQVVDRLRELELVVEDRAFPGRFGLQSRLKAATKLIDALGPVERLAYDPREVIRLRDADGRLVDYTETSFTQSARSEVLRLNEAFRSVDIKLAPSEIVWDPIALHIDEQVVHPAQVMGYRVFNVSWQLGGRLYGPFWQSLPKEWRAKLIIDGDAVAEPDHSQLHPRLLYAEFGSQPDGDAYTIAGYEDQRPMVKCAWQMMINANSRSSAVAALAIEMGGLRFQAEASALLAVLEKQHEAVASAFYTGAGLRLQRRDADLMMRIQKRCLAEGIVALPVHDSFVVQQGRRSQRVSEIMVDELGRLLPQGSEIE